MQLVHPHARCLADHPSGPVSRWAPGIAVTLPAGFFATTGLGLVSRATIPSLTTNEEEGPLALPHSQRNATGRDAISPRVLRSVGWGFSARGTVARDDGSSSR